MDIRSLPAGMLASHVDAIGKLPTHRVFPSCVNPAISHDDVIALASSYYANALTTDDLVITLVE
jgi:hypothetical protein